MQKLSKDLETTEKLCSSLQQGYQEYCPDVRRQEAKVKGLQIRYANINNQLTERYVAYCHVGKCTKMEVLSESEAVMALSNKMLLNCCSQFFFLK